MANTTREEARRPFAARLAITAAAGWFIALVLGWAYTALDGAHQRQVADVLRIENELRHELEEQRQTAARYAMLYERTSALQARQLGRDHDEAGPQGYDAAMLARSLEKTQSESATPEQAAEAGRTFRDHLASVGIQLERLARERQQVEVATSALASERDKLAAEVHELEHYRERLSAEDVSLSEDLAEKNIDYTTATAALQLARAELMALESKPSVERHDVQSKPRRRTIPRSSRRGTTGRSPDAGPVTTSGTERSGPAASRKASQASAIGEEMMVFKRDQ